MRFACTSCLTEREIPSGAAWPTSCECGGTAWTSVPVEPKMLAHVGAFDSANAANALLRQPGSPLDSFRGVGASYTPH